MSLRLILTRHAKSDWGDAETPDHDRPLNARGRRSAGAIGGWLSRKGYVPGAALLSTATRVRETWDEISTALDHEVAVTWKRQLYLSSPEEILDILIDRTESCVILLAHNPGLGSLAQWLAEEPPQRGEFDRFPTCATLVMDFDAPDWGAIGPLTGRVVDFVVPRDLTD